MNEFYEAVSNLLEEMCCDSGERELDDIKLKEAERLGTSWIIRKQHKELCRTSFLALCR